METAKIILYRKDGSPCGETLVDQSDYEALAQFTWRRISAGSGRASCVGRGSREGGKFHLILMHRVLLPGARIVDHINRNPMDNRRCNLRAATHSQNRANSGSRPHGAPLKGVTKANGGKFQAQINYQGTARYLGRFTTPEEAHAAYCREAVRIHGEFACFG